MRELLVIPAILFTLAVLVLVGWYIFTGAPVDRAMVFTGGTEVRVSVADSVDNPRSTIVGSFDAEPESATRVVGSNSYIVQFAEGDTTPDEIQSGLDQNEGLSVLQLSQVSPSLGNDAQITAIYGMMAAFVLMSLFVMILFRSFIPAVVIILSAVSNIVVALAVMNLVGIELSMGTVGALLMLIGYSVDSDILLNTHVLRGAEGKGYVSRVHRAMTTGVTMTITSLSAMVVMTIVARIFGIGLLTDMGFVLSIGLAMDLVNTYMMNVSILRWYDSRGDTQ